MTSATTATPKQLSQTALTATLTTTLYTATGVTGIIKEILLCNTDTSARTVTIYAGNGSAAANTIISARSLAAGETWSVELSTVLTATHTIKGGASAGSVVSCTISGVEVV